ncbi:helix-turn-helix transcriptional regulator [Mycobacterium sp. M1]|uniref:Helix-turn-helix transcriptional regulator n=1 Tax=Mycolicibacter acidiphilus TaxID=2835306 RepID=A0ABS5RQ41_9MYCO|nr:helix-turn-helix transcriptional regulator [Mycolicibacter acidiphilus]MBS9535084.1 helix-turn-helix transcriptional regulator [Mycolicibacter acidiphilus]
MTDELTGKRLAELRRQAGLSQQKQADAMGVQPSMVSRIERQKTWMSSTLERYLSALGGTTTLTVRGGTVRIRWTADDGDKDRDDG